MRPVRHTAGASKLFPSIPTLAACCLLLGLGACSVLPAQEVTDHSSAPTHHHTHHKYLPSGSLVIVGGGDIGPEIAKRFVELAGGANARVVLIPTAAKDAERIDHAREVLRDTFGLKHVVVLHTHNRAVANSEEFVAPLKEATGVWISGGRQWKLVDAYLGTRTQREIEAVLKRGGVVGGSSAGATIQGSFLVRGAREGNRIMVAKDYMEGFGLLKNTAIDQHVLTRGRENDLGPVVAAYPGLLGLGIDESTAVVVHGDRFQVIGKSLVAVNDGRDHGGKPYFFLKPGQSYDLSSRSPVVAQLRQP